MSERYTEYRWKIDGTLLQSQQSEPLPGGQYHRVQTPSRHPGKPSATELKEPLTENKRKPEPLETQSAPNAPQTDPSWRGHRRANKAKPQES